MRDLEAELASLMLLDQTRDLLARVVCQNAISTECLNAIQQVNAAVNSYNRANGGFDRIWENNRSAGLLRDFLTAGPAWDPAAFGFGLAAGAALGLHTVLGAAAVREAVAICAGNPYCTAKVITKMVGEVVLADISGGAAIISTPGGKTVRVELSPSLRIPSTTASVAPNLSSRGTLINLYPADLVVMETTPRTLQLIDGRYWLITNSGQRLTPTGTINFVTLPNGTIRVATQNNISNYSTHLGLSKGGEVSYAGTITFPNGLRCP